MTLKKLPADPGFSEIALEGKIQAEDVPAEGTANPIAGVLVDGWTHSPLLMDFSKLTFIGSAGIGWMMRTLRELKTGGGAKLICHSIKPQILQALSLFKLESTSMIFAPNRESAVKLLAPVKGQAAKSKRKKDA